MSTERLPVALVSAIILDIIRKTISFSNFQDRGDGSWLIIGSCCKKNLHWLIISNKMYPFSLFIPALTSPKEAILLDERLFIQIGYLLLSHLSALRHGSLQLCLNENSPVITFAGKLAIFGEEEAQF